ncbi:Superfamily II DNA or RNA helicase, SNF2 family [Clostridium acidisoli DSM 12555]|uniref:Superfamily II DNA or RNA helicase, SNF2 family n=1 Tax=Clostridium acidisoli DSM 12555 TaxID=1121291 RepID=A0A1W1XVJ3_9CLOT|nr:DEAD/DEAH box helicase [Clostridium acidisoli]SMC27979.1 Superfamily II DNA or RNA helicase, SNF2 family [Clostridium acidisoli DSM 12555]
MDRDALLQIFNENTSGKNQNKGLRVFNNDLVSSVEIDSEDDLININSTVISENLFNEYTAQIELDTLNKSIISTYCSCKDFESNEFRKENYCCKHLVATYYKALDELLKHPLLNKPELQKTFKPKTGMDTLSILLGEDEGKKEIKIEIYINRGQWDNKLSCEFKIGLKSMSSNSLYVLKDINQFLFSMYNNTPVTYGKNFILSMKEDKIGSEDKKLLDFIQMVKGIESDFGNGNKKRVTYIDGKYLKIPDYLIREFFLCIKNHRVYLNEGFLSRFCETEIVESEPNIEFDLKTIKKDYVLKINNGIPEVLGSRNNVFLYGTTIYVPSYEYCDKIEAYLNVFNEARVVTLPVAKEDTILRKLVPELNILSNYVKLSKEIREKIVTEKCEFKFYFDKEGKDITLITKVKYGSYEFNIFQDCNEKIIYRDSKTEIDVLGKLRTLGFEEVKNKFYLMWGDDYAFRFFKNEIGKLQKIGEVFYSENFKGIKSLSAKTISADIRSGKYNYFEMEFKLGDISSKETTEILRAFRDNVKYYKLKSGEYLDLEDIEIRKFLKLIDSVAPKVIKDNKIDISNNMGIYLDEYMEENKIRYIKGRKELKKIRNKLKDIDKLTFKEPKNINGELREYQKIGYNWFKTLDYLNFGGILGDEMGLGKTFQAITFLLSSKGSKSLIVTPTSLVYNWANEFEKFAPSMNIATVNGSRSERECIIKNIDKYDVIITTYNLLKRDLDIYCNLEFEYCIIDEAQYIKNSHSQNATSVKSIIAKRKFALSGTPIENSVMELWSIFDFIMPGYLYDEKTFSVKYHKKIKEEPEVIEDLNRRVKPFILRRKKSEVIKELPDKIEKTLFVKLEDKQKNVYGIYAKHVLELIEKKVKEDEFKNSKIEILAYITKLRQLCLDPSIVMEEYDGSNAKIEALTEILKHSIYEGHRILVFSQFTSVLKNIGGRISTEGIQYSYLDGSIPSQKRMDIVDNFNNGENSVFLISLKAGGTGLNLTSADIVIHFDPWWNPAVENQATDRAHRIGQKNVVEVIKLVAKGTIEEKIILLQEEKKKLIDSLLGEELSGEQGISALSENEIVNLFR